MIIEYQKRKIYLNAFFSLFILTMTDQITKSLAVKFLKGNNGKVLIKGILELQYLENKGMAFGMLQGKYNFLVFFCLLFLAGFCYFFWKVPATHYYRLLRISVILIGAGAIGNLIDRLVRKYVIDYIYISWIDFPVFNVADIFVVCGGIALILLIFFRYKEEDFVFLR